MTGGGFITALSARRCSDGIGKGTTVRITFPRIDSSGRSIQSGVSVGSISLAWAEADAPISLSGLGVIVIDDESDGRDATAAVLEQFGASVVAVPSVDAGLQEAMRRQPDVIVSDIAMPGRDGFDWMDTLRSTSDGLADVPVISVTAYASADDRKRVLHAGFAAWLAKPVDVSELVRMIRLLGGVRPGTAD